MQDSHIIPEEDYMGDDGMDLLGEDDGVGHHDIDDKLEQEM